MMRLRGTNHNAVSLRARDSLWSWEFRYFPFKGSLSILWSLCRNCVAGRSSRSLSTHFSLATFTFCPATPWTSDPVWERKGIKELFFAQWFSNMPSAHLPSQFPPPAHYGLACHWGILPSTRNQKAGLSLPASFLVFMFIGWALRKPSLF